MRRLFFLAVLALCVTVFAAEPATRPAGNDNVVGQMRVQTLPEMNFLCGSQKTTFAELEKVYAKFIPLLAQGVEEGKIQPRGAMMSVYRDFREKSFTLEVGMIVAPASKDVGELKFRKTAPFKCATILYVGPVQGIAAGYEKLMGQMQARGLEPTGEGREMYLYWEKPDSPNNVIQLQMGCK